MYDFARLKPDPIPNIRPVPEYAARGELADLYERTKTGLGVPWMGVVAMAFARYPRFYECLWLALEPVVRSTAFSNACADLRASAEREAGLLSPRPIQPRLQELGYGHVEIDEIRACNEVFSAGNMPYVLMASLARMLLEGHQWTGAPHDLEEVHAPSPGPKPPLIEPHHADADTLAIYSDIRKKLGLPFVNTDYRAFARWPTYFSAAWRDLKSAVESDGYEASVTRVHHCAITCASTLPNTAGITSSDMRKAAATDAPLEEVLEVVRLFQWLLPGLIVNVAFLRGALRDAVDVP